MNTFSVWLGGGERSEISKRCETTWQDGHEIFSSARLSSVCPWLRDLPYFRDAYAASHWAGASDIARLAVLFELGGCYIDTDVEVVDKKRLDALNDGEFHIGAEDDKHLCGAVMIAPPKHPFTKRMLDLYKATKFSDTFNGKRNGTTMLTEQGLRDPEVAIHSNHVFYPWHWSEKLTDNQKGERIELLKPITAHHWEHSWTQVNQKE